jgi:hypothetical protein
MRAEERKNHGARVEAGWGKRRERRLRAMARSSAGIKGKVEGGRPALGAMRRMTDQVSAK